MIKMQLYKLQPRSNNGGGHLKEKPTKHPHKRLILGIILTFAMATLLPIGVYAVQNIFTDFGQITDIQYGGKNIDKVVYQGETIWERLSPITDGMNMQDATNRMCQDTPIGTTVKLIDSRDGKIYRVRKMVDSRCWMIDSLAYDINSAPLEGKPVYAITPEYDSTPSGAPNLTSVDTKPQYAASSSAYNIPNNGNPMTTYLYNWCAAMGDTSANCAITRGYGAGQPATPQTGICPAPFRLPIGGAEPTTPGNGTNQATAAITTTSEFSKLDIWMGGTGTIRTSANTYGQWMSTAPTADSWAGVFSGYYGSGLTVQGVYGYWWTSTAHSGIYGHRLSLGVNNAHVFPSGHTEKYIGFAVRCIL